MEQTDWRVELDPSGQLASIAVNADLTDERYPTWTSEVLIAKGLPTHVRSVMSAVKKRFCNQELVREFTFSLPSACPETTRAHEWLATCDFLCKLDTMEPVDPH